MISVDIALSRVLAGLTASPPETVPLPQILGRVLAQDLIARVSHPSVDVSAMDGYALRAADAGQNVTVIGESSAGHPFDREIAAGQALRIFTGAQIPKGADCVIMQEEAVRTGDCVRFTGTAPAAGAFIRPAGLDFSPGQTLLRAGTRMAPRHLGLAAAMNLPWASVHRRPRVAVLSTGDEIAMPGEPLGPAHLVSSNGPAIAALIAAAGAEPVQLGIAKDSRESLEYMIKAAHGCDLLVTSGGASVGDYDLVQDVLAANGMDLDFWKIAMRPGKPLMFGSMRNIPVLGLPGNPVSAMICAYVFLMPMLRALQGLPQIKATRPVRLGAAMPANDARQGYVRGALTCSDAGEWTANPLSKQDSAVLTGLAAADCLIIRPPHAAAAQAGDWGNALPLTENM